jgi:hypothetical protein
MKKPSYFLLGACFPFFWILMGGLFLIICLLLFCKEQVDRVYDYLYKDFII